MLQCQGITKDNFRCSRKALEGEGARFCRQHQTIEDRKQQLIVEAEIKTEADRLAQLGRDWRRRREQMPGTLEHYLVTTNFKKPHYGWQRARRPGTERTSQLWREQRLNDVLRRLKVYAENLLQTQ